jgi:hypothetical protein
MSKLVLNWIGYETSEIPLWLYLLGNSWFQEIFIAIHPEIITIQNLILSY